MWGISVLCWRDTGAADAQLLGGQLEAGAVSAVPALCSAAALQGNLNSSFILTPTSVGYGEGAGPVLQLWKESVACGIHGSFSLFPTTNAVLSSQYCPSLRQNKVCSLPFGAGKA